MVQPVEVRLQDVCSDVYLFTSVWPFCSPLKSNTECNMMHTHIYICDLMKIHLQNIHTRMYKTHDAVATGVSAARLLLFFTVQCSESLRLRSKD